MRLPNTLLTTGAGFFTPFAVLFLQDTFKTMLPWIFVMLTVVTCDLIAGIRKSLKLDIHVSWSMAFRETMGKMVVYVAFVLMVAMIDAASEHSFSIAMWGCLFICALEGGSIISNILKPYGIDITPKSIVKTFSIHVGHFTDEEADELVGDDNGKKDKLESIRTREKNRWEKRHKHQHGSNIEAHERH